MDKIKRIKRGKWDFGEVGESTGEYAFKNGIEGKHHLICVGDVVSFVEHGITFTGVVMKSHGRFGVMGHGVDRLNYEKITLSVPFEKVPIEMINAIHRADFEFVEEKAEEMTVEEIERALGKRIKIVK